jgi:hypothetical protein
MPSFSWGVPFSEYAQEISNSRFSQIIDSAMNRFMRLILARETDLVNMQVKIIAANISLPTVLA